MAHQVTREEIAAFNRFREKNVGKVFTTEEIKQALRNIDELPKSDSLLSYLSQGDNSPIIRIRRGEYRVNDQPVHISRLQFAFNKKAIVQKHAVTKAKMRTVGIPEKPTKDDFQKCIGGLMNNDIQKAIALLKANGYRVLKPITQYEEV